MSDINSKEYLEKILENAPEGATHFDNAVSYYKSSGINNSWGIWKGVWCVSVGCNTMRMPPSMRQIQDAKSQLDMIYELEKLQAENAELKKQSRWISVDDELPKENSRIITFRVRGEELMSPWGDYDNYWVCDLCYTSEEDLKSNWKEITHWMPMPAPPEVE